jgi:hypothetical protein
LPTVGPGSDGTHCGCAAQNLVAKSSDRKLKVAFLQDIVVSVHLQIVTVVVGKK